MNLKKQISEKEVKTLDQERKQFLRDLLSLKPKVLEHIKDSISATLICSYCNDSGEAAKKDADGKCLNCHGAKVIPDVKRREWATEEIAARFLPKPKSVEMTVDEGKGYEKFKSALKEKTDRELGELVEKLGVSFGEEISDNSG